MGWAAGRKLRRAIDGFTRVLAIELLTAARAIAMREGKPGEATATISNLINGATGGPGADRFISPDIDAVVALVESRQVLQAAEKSIGNLE